MPQALARNSSTGPHAAAAAARLKVLLVDEDEDLADLVAFALRQAGIASLAAHDLNTALRVAAAERVDLVVLDPAVRGPAGRDTIAEVKRWNRHVPLIVLSTQTSERYKVDALERGADDYLAKPFSHRELIARIRARLRVHEAAAPPPEDEMLQVGPLSLDTARRQVVHDGRSIRLTGTETRLLRALMAEAGRVVSRQQLVQHLGAGESTDALRVALHRLRRKIEPPAQSGLRPLLRTIPGVGVMLGEPRQARGRPHPAPPEA